MTRHSKQAVINCYAVQKARHPFTSKRTVPHNVQVQKISLPTPRMVNGNSKGVGVGVSTAQFVKGKYKAKLEILGESGGAGGRGTNQVTILCGGMYIFWNHPISNNSWSVCVVYP